MNHPSAAAPDDGASARWGLPELDEVQALARAAGAHLQVRTLCEVDTGGCRLPVQALLLGNPDPALPAVGLFGGVHGLERIGAEVVMSCLRGLVNRLAWDATLHHLLDGLRLVVAPMLNPGGALRSTRANPNGVDLMRNAPVECTSGAPFLLGGQRLSASLPWFRGNAGDPMEAEARALCQLVTEEMLGRPFAIGVDCHSGFGLADRLWFPHAHTPRPIEHLPELHALRQLLDASLLHHRYVFEPQSHQYLTHGDLWDHLYLQSLAGHGGPFLPLTLEMGSWLWIKKNPRQFFSRHGIFNPLIAHRQQRVLRRHMALLDFVMRAAHSHRRWVPNGPARSAAHEEALDHWYRDRRNRP
jgi:hypothetical protein